MRLILFAFLLLPLCAFGQGSTRTFDTVGQMTNQVPSQIATGGKITVDVRGTSGLPGGVFYWDAASVAAVDEVTYFPANTSGRWVRASFWFDGSGGGGSTNDFQSTATVFPILTAPNIVQFYVPTNSDLSVGVLPPLVANSLWENNAWRDLSSIFLAGTNTTVTISGGTVKYNASAGGGTNGSTVYVFGSQYPNLNFIDDPTPGEPMRVGIFATTNLYIYMDWAQFTNHLVAGANMSIAYGANILTLNSSGGAGSTNGTPVYVDAAGPLTSLNIGDNTEINHSVSGTNLTSILVANSVGTNKITSGFYTWLLSLAGSSFTFTNGVTNAAGVVHGNYRAGSNITLTTNNSAVTIAAVLATNSGTAVKVNGGTTLSTASFDTTSFIGFNESGGSVTSYIVAGSVRSNELSTDTISYFLNRTNHTGTQNWTTLHSLPTSIARIADVGAGTSGDILFRDATGWTNLAKSTDGLVLKLASGLPSWQTDSTGGGGGGSGTNIFVGATTLVQPAHLVDSANATWSVASSTNIAVTFTGVGSATNGYLFKSATIITNKGGDGNLEHLHVTIPANTLSEDGDELVFTIPGSYRNYLNTNDEYFSWSFNWDDLPLVLAEYSLTNSPANTTTIRGVMWDVRLKRLSRSNLVALASCNVGFGLAEAQNVINYLRASSVSQSANIAMGSTDFSTDLTFILTAQHSGNSDTNDILTTFGYTVLKPGSAGGAVSDVAYASSWNGVTSISPSKNSVYDWGHIFDTDDDGKVNVVDTGAGAIITDSGGVVSAVSTTGSGNVMRTRTGVPRYLIMDSGYFQPEATEPATATTNAWATTTDRVAKASWDFSATTTNGVFAGFVFPMEWDSGTLNVKLYWKQVTAEANTTNVWQAAIGSLGDNETGGAVLGTAVTVLDQGLNDTNKLAITSWSTAITPGNTGAPGDGGSLSIRRLPGHASDNMTVTTRLLGVLLEYTESTTEPTDN